MLCVMQASMPSQSGLQQLVEAAGGIAAENKENASRKRGRELCELVAPPQKQASCSYHVQKTRPQQHHHSPIWGPGCVLYM